jgi:peptidoglycan/LPS O-acetylase OafA/YrhL
MTPVATPKPTDTAPKLIHMPGLDGLRALAIAAVMLYHGGVQWLPGGFLGVDVFFVLSGFLITSLLIGEFSATAKIDLRAFYLARVRRLAPALVVMLFATATYATLFMSDAAASTWRDLPWALDGLSNWWFVFHQQDYFESIGRPMVLQHTWSLAVETQFYLVWPVALIFVLPAFGKRGVRAGASVCALASAAAMFWFGTYSDAASSRSVSHMYFGTDTHSMGLFLGAVLATIWQPAARLRATGATRGAFEVLTVLSVVGLAALLHTVDGSTGHLIGVGFPIVGLLTALLIFLATYPGLHVGMLLGIAPLRWIGERSYGMYLWHWPVFQATRPGIDVRLPEVADLALRFALTVAFAELSYRFVEMPVRRGALRRLWLRSRTWSPQRFRLATASIACAVLLVAVTEGLLAARAISANAALLQPLVVPVDAAPAGPPVVRSAHPNRRHALRPEQLPAILLGDSIMLGTSKWIAHYVNVVRVDAVVSRQESGVLDRTRQLAEAGKLEPTMILNLGNNGTVDERTLRTILHLLRGCAHVVVINASVPRPWQDPNDILMARVVPTYRNAVLADWRAVAAVHPNYLGADGVHPNALGARAYALLATSALDAGSNDQRAVR